MPSDYESKPCTVDGCGGRMVYTVRVVSPRPEPAPGEFTPLGVPRRGWICDRNPDHLEYDEAPEHTDDRGRLIIGAEHPGTCAIFST